MLVLETSSENLMTIKIIKKVLRGLIDWNVTFLTTTHNPVEYIAELKKNCDVKAIYIDNT